MRFPGSLYLFSLFLVSSFLFYSCQKEVSEEKNTTKISSNDPNAISSSIKVWHGLRTEGNAPPQSGSALVLNNTSTDPLQSIAGRYAIIKPEVISGDVSGYYLKVNGASDYFKIDYTKPRNTERQIQQKHKTFALRMDSTGGILDSAVVVVLPPNLHVPDTICMTYWAYDNGGNVSNPVNVCIIINSIGTDANGAWLNGTWRNTALWDNSLHDTIIYNRWITEETGGLYCENGMLQWSNDPLPGRPFLANDSTFHRKSDLTYGANGGLKYENEYSWKGFDYLNITCSNIVFEPVQNVAETSTGAWSYNSSTHKLVMVIEFDDAGMPVEEAYEVDVIKMNEKAMLFIFNSDPSDLFYQRYEKF